MRLRYLHCFLLLVRGWFWVGLHLVLSLSATLRLSWKKLVDSYRQRRVRVSLLLTASVLYLEHGLLLASATLGARALVLIDRRLLNRYHGWQIRVVATLAVD